MALSRSFGRAFAAASIIFAAASAQAALSANARAQLFAGRLSGEAEADAIERSPAWRNALPASTTAVFNAPSSYLSPAKLAEVSAFAAAAFPGAHADASRVLYLFGGADFPYASVLFPNMPEIVLVGLERVGSLPDVAKMAAGGALAGKMSQIGTAFRDLANDTYFITVNMAKQIGEFGMSTMLAVGAAARGYAVVSVDPIAIGANGAPVVDPRGNGARIVVQSPDGRQITIYYFAQDLSDASFARNPAFETFLRGERFDAAYYKAASFVSHAREFGRVDGIVTQSVRYVIQDDDGLPWNAFDKTKWDITLYGLYARPGPVFGRGWQADYLQSFAISVCDSGNQQAIADMETIWRAQGQGNLCARFARVLRDPHVRWSGYVPFRYGYGPFSGTVGDPGLRAKTSNIVYAVAR